MKYLVTLEFRYDILFEDEERFTSKKITLGVFDKPQEAVNCGNVILKKLENSYSLVHGEKKD